MATLGDIVINLRANSGQFVGGVGRARGSLTGLHKTSKGAHGSLGQLATQTGLVDSRLSMLAGTAGLTAAAVAAVGFAAVKSLAEYADYTRQLQKSFAIQELTADQQQRMSDAARTASRDVSASAGQMAEAYFFLASAGFDAEQQIAALPAVAAFAQAGNFDLALATDLLTDSQSALGLSSDDAAQNLENLTRVSDVLLGANTLANASAQQFAESLTAGVGAQARTLGIEVEELTAALAVFADQGIKGADSSTLLSIALRDLETKAIKNRAAFVSAGVAVHDSEGEFRRIEDVVGDLERSLAGLSDEARKIKLMEMGFSDKSVKALLLLLGTSTKIREYRLELEQMAGKTSDVADNSLTRLDRATNANQKSFADLKFEVGNLTEALASPILESFSGQLDAAASSAKFLLGPLADVTRELETWEQRGAAKVVANIRLAEAELNSLFEQVLELTGLKNPFAGLQPDELDFSHVQGELNDIAGSADGIEKLASWFVAGTQHTGELVTAIQSVHPELAALTIENLLRDFRDGTKTASELRAAITGISDAAPLEFDFAVDLTDVEHIGGAFEQQQNSIGETTRRQAALNRAFGEGALNAEEFGRATRAVEAARDQATGGSAALVTSLQQELELIGLNITERERLAAILQDGARIEDADRVAGLRTELAIAGELLMLKTQLAEAKFGKDTVAAGTRLGVGIDQMDQFAGGDFAALGLDPAQLQQMAELKNQITAQDASKVERDTVRPKQQHRPQEDRRDRSAAEVGTGDAFSRVLAAMRQPANSPELKEQQKQTTKLGQLVTKTGDLVRAVEDGGGELVA